MPLIPLYGHRELVARLLDAAAAGRIPASLLLHGAAGAGKQRLALHVAQALVCTGEPKPCGVCQHCGYALEASHPDIHWIFPRGRLKGTDAIEDIDADLAEGIAERLSAGGLYARPSGDQGIFVATIRSIVKKASLSPGLARRKVFVIGDAERMVPQEGAEFAANAFLKLLEEPLPDTQIILTSSEPAALLPTIRSRVVAVRVPRLGDEDVRALLEHPQVEKKLRRGDRGIPAMIAAAGGAPGALLTEDARSAAAAAARKVLDAAATPAGPYSAALSQGLSGARGGFADMLDALTTVLVETARDAARTQDSRRAVAAARAIAAVEDAKTAVTGNVNPQLLTWNLVHEIRTLLR